MSLAKVIEVIAESDVSWEDAAKNAVTEAGETIRNIRHLYVKDMQCIVEGDTIVKWRLNCNVTFVVDSNRED
ncbi:MAG: dodecin family protein [Bacteroidota bacterium]